jgi:Transposase DDE domain group 1
MDVGLDAIRAVRRWQAVGETQERPFQGARVTYDGGLILVRELDERLGLSELMDRHLSDSRRGKNIQLPLADLLRQWIYSRSRVTQMLTTPRASLRIRPSGSLARGRSGSGARP